MLLNSYHNYYHRLNDQHRRRSTPRTVLLMTVIVTIVIIPKMENENGREEHLKKILSSLRALVATSIDDGSNNEGNGRSIVTMTYRE